MPECDSPHASGIHWHTYRHRTAPRCNQQQRRVCKGSAEPCHPLYGNRSWRERWWQLLINGHWLIVFRCGDFARCGPPNPDLTWRCADTCQLLAVTSYTC